MNVEDMQVSVIPAITREATLVLFIREREREGGGVSVKLRECMYMTFLFFVE